MFDGISRLFASQPRPPRPAPLDTLALLPVIRTHAVEALVKTVAIATGANAYSALCWAGDNWGADADLRDRCHPARVAALDPASPLYKLVEAQEALFDACCEYRAVTGDDGLAFAREIIEHQYTPSIADYALAPLQSRSVAEWDIETMLANIAPKPEPTPKQRDTYAKAAADWLLSDPDMGTLADALRGLLDAFAADGGNPHGPRAAPAVARVQHAIQAALERVGDGERRDVAELMQVTLGSWTEAYSGPRIIVTVGRPSGG